MKELTKAEEQVMQYLWKIEKGFAKDVLGEFPDPKPAYSTVSTMIRILVKKEYVGYKAYGKTYEYYPLIAKRDYRKVFFKKVMKSYFSNSIKKFTSFFTNENDLSLTELEEIKEIVEEQIRKKRETEDNNETQDN